MEHSGSNSPRYSPETSASYSPRPYSPGYVPLRLANPHPPHVLASIEPEGDPLVALQAAIQSHQRAFLRMRDEALRLEEEIEHQAAVAAWLNEVIEHRDQRIENLEVALRHERALVDQLLAEQEERENPPSPSPPTPPPPPPRTPSPPPFSPITPPPPSPSPPSSSSSLSSSSSPTAAAAIGAVEAAVEAAADVAAGLAAATALVALAAAAVPPPEPAALPPAPQPAAPEPAVAPAEPAAVAPAAAAPKKRKRRGEAELLGPVTEPEAGRGGKRRCKVERNYKV